MIGLTIFVVWVLVASTTGTITHQRLLGDKAWTKHATPDLIFVLIVTSVAWPITLTVYTTKGVINAPERRRQKRELARQMELDQARHETDLIAEQAAKAEAQYRLHKAHGLP
ncbi:hypothetical protein GII36_01880 [Candidatus Mycosynbacter amalyticus]|uniref:Uncharacterized protein n=1 Tax=Candidatus Mycosynbacter amalyticus TaxID=2665156 RepID=A0A857MKD5_9BACT|nr:hypothetical protein [Candidatus Mycosynbacter amalyticus]QHN42598.1 hypothetical protein GII36_01880 [Candidatus Mycosynbacter amalyticus]